MTRSLSLIILAAGGLLSAADHPRLLLSATDVPALRARANLAPYAAMAVKIKAQAAKVPDPDGKLLYDKRPRDLATLYLLTGDQQYAAAAEEIVVKQVNDAEYWNSPQSKGLARAAGALTVAIAFDACFDAWSAATRNLVDAKLRAAADGIMASMGAGANSGIANNWQAVRYASAGIAFLASDQPDGVDKAKGAFAKLKAHIIANLGENGWNPEGIGYTAYPWQFTGPFAIAAERAGAGDLMKEVKQAQRTFWTLFAGTVAMPRPGGLGLRADLGDDHPVGGGSCGGMAFRFVPPEHLPGFRFMYDRLCGAQGDGTYDAEGGLGILSMLYYPDKIPAQDPTTVPGLGRNYTDPSAGIAIFRNRFQDADDIVMVVNGHARQPPGAHGGCDTNTWRLLGLGSCWVVGSGRTGDANGQTNLFIGPPPSKGAKGLGKLDATEFAEDGGGRATTSGSCMGVTNQRRLAAIDFSGTSGAPAVVVMAETSTNATLWRLNTPEFNAITTSEHGFTITAPNGATLVATVIEPAKLQCKTGSFERGGGAGHAGFPFGDKKYINNSWIEFPCDQQTLVVFTLQPKGKPAPVVTGSGSAKQATLAVGGQAVTVDEKGVAIKR
jgi:hypothetical protein